MARLTAIAAEKAKLPERGQIDMRDPSRPGLALRISHTGRKVWTMHLRQGGQLKRIKLGEYPAMGLGEAREAWLKARAARAAGKDARVELAHDPKRGESFDEVLARWIEQDRAG